MVGFRSDPCLQMSTQTLGISHLLIWIIAWPGLKVLGETSKPFHVSFFPILRATGLELPFIIGFSAELI